MRGKSPRTTAYVHTLVCSFLSRTGKPGILLVEACEYIFTGFVAFCSSTFHASAACLIADLSQSQWAIGRRAVFKYRPHYYLLYQRYHAY